MGIANGAGDSKEIKSGAETSGQRGLRRRALNLMRGYALLDRLGFLYSLCLVPAILP